MKKVKSKARKTKRPLCKKPALIRRVSSGVPGFDKLVQGGFKEKHINLIIGGPGSGKTIFAIMFLLEGLKNNEPGVYITFEEQKEKLYDDVRSFGWDLEQYEKKGLFVYLEYTPEQVKKVLIEGGGMIDNVVSRIKAKRLVIDSITSFTLLYKEELTKKEAALALFEMINDWGCTALLTSQDTSLIGIEISSTLAFEVDSIIILYHMKKNGTRIRGLEILKMRGTKTPDETYALKICADGLRILPKKIKDWSK